MDKVDPDLTITPDGQGFERDYNHKYRKAEELEVQLEFTAWGENLTALMEDADERAAEWAQGREHYIWRILAERDGDGLTAEVCMYVMVPRIEVGNSQEPRDA